MLLIYYFFDFHNDNLSSLNNALNPLNKRHFTFYSLIPPNRAPHHIREKNVL